MRIQSLVRRAEAAECCYVRASGAAIACTVAAATVLVAISTNAQAECVPDPHVTGVINCTTDQTDGVDIGVPAGETATLNIQTGIEVSTSTGDAVRGGDGNETINNAGRVVGSVTLGAGEDRFNLSTDADFSDTTHVDGGDSNDDLFELSGAGVGELYGHQHSGFETLEITGDGTWTLRGHHDFRFETIITGGRLDLADGAVFESLVVNNYRGTLSVAGPGKIGQATFKGIYRQDFNGAYDVDVDPQSGKADLIVVTAAADLKGVVNVNFLTALKQGTQRFEIVRAVGNSTIDDSPGVGTLVVGDVTGQSNPAGVRVTLERGADERTIVLAVTARSPVSTTRLSQPNRIKLNAMVTTTTNGSATAAQPNLSPLDTLATTLINGPTTIDQYRAALDVLLPEVYLNTQTAMLFSAGDFMSDLFSCPTADDGAAFMREGQCVWVRPKGRKLDRDDTAEAIGYEDTVGGVSAGAQFNFAPGWVANVGASYESGTLKTDTAARSESDRYHLGGAVKYEIGPWLFAGAVAGGIGDFDTTRQIAFTGFNETATSDHDVIYVAGQLRAAYQFAMPGWYVRPLVDVNLTYLDRDGLTEGGAAGANLTVAGGEETMFSATPAVEIGGVYEIVPGATLKPFLMAGVTVFADDDHSLTSAFALAPDATFETVTEHGDVFANIHAGTTLVGHDSGFNLTLGYKGLYSNDITQHGVYAKGRVKF
ncbi:MAG: autotransporter domain-containing protein [Pseudomonadota bacterium]